MAFADVLALDELSEGRPRAVRVAGRDIVLVRFRGRVRALRNRCPHQSQSFVSGTIEPKPHRGSDPGTVGMCIDEYVLMCPWHKWTFDIDTGVCAVDPSYRVRAYPTRVENGRVFVDLAARIARPPAADLGVGEETRERA
jgi:nitrite reductase/ring-hydroxylating ferredoxin subunit